MFVCISNCVPRYEGPSVAYALAIPFLHSYGPCEFCHKVGLCVDLKSGDPNWYPKKED